MTKAEKIYEWVKSNYSSPSVDSTRPIPSIHKLIAQTGASKATVEKALNKLVDDGIVRAEHGRGFFPVPLTERPGNIEFVLGPSQSVLEQSSFHWWIFSGIARGAAEISRDIHISSALFKDPDKLVENFISALSSRSGVFGVLVLDMRNDRLFAGLRDIRIPAVSLDYDSASFGIDCVVTDSEDDAFILTDKLISEGHRNLAIIPGIVDGAGEFIDPDYQARLKGYKRALEAHSIKYDENRVVLEAPRRQSESQEILRKLFESGTSAVIMDYPELKRLEGLLRVWKNVRLGVISGFAYQPPEFALGRTLLIRYNFEEMGRKGTELLAKRARIGSGRAATEKIKAVFEEFA